MVCFDHVDRPAVGHCGHCHKGLCSECATTVEGVLCCAECKEIVAATQKYVRRNMEAAGYLKPKNVPDEPCCSFCAKPRDQVAYLVAGPTVQICDSCVGICSAFIKWAVRQKKPLALRKVLNWIDPIPPEASPEPLFVRDPSSGRSEN